MTPVPDIQRLRIEDLMRILPRGRASLLDVGTRDGKIATLAADVFPLVVALDLKAPPVLHPQVRPIAGDATRLPFRDDAFDCGLCAEVMEHIPAVSAAAAEIARVARHEVIIGTPYWQDLRVGRTKCPACGKRNPPYGHLHRFDQRRLLSLFPGLTLTCTSFVGATREVTNPVSAFLMDLAGNPYGTYDQQEPCMYCGSVLKPAGRISGFRRVLAGVAARLERAQRAFVRARPIWMHVVLSKQRDVP